MASKLAPTYMKKGFLEKAIKSIKKVNVEKVVLVASLISLVATAASAAAIPNPDPEQVDRFDKFLRLCYSAASQAMDTGRLDLDKLDRLKGGLSDYLRAMKVDQDAIDKINLGIDFLATRSS
ncbi:MAG: hypothetical protein NT069_18350 [Planctomycetota bacterium]|nr:hypothetical protein [Planctomycetota bacterium]